MNILLITGLIMGLLSAIFWVLEFKPFLDKVKSLSISQSKNPLKMIQESINYITGFINATISLWPLALDITCTLWLTAAFGFGSGLIGGIIGLLISNVISVFLIFNR